MGKLTVTAFSTLDNVAEEPQLWTGPFFSDATVAYNEQVLAGADSMLLGRVTYDGFAASWPSRSGDFTADTFNAMPKYVLSTTLDHAGWNNSTIIADDIPGQVRELRERENGRGKKMLPEDGTRHTLRIVELELLEGGMLALRMAPAGC